MTLYHPNKVCRPKQGRKYKPYIPLTENDIGGFNSVDLDRMTAGDLRELKDQLEDLRNEMLSGEPEEWRGAEYRFWDLRLCRVEEFLEQVRDLLAKVSDGPADSIHFS